MGSGVSSAGQTRQRSKRCDQRHLAPDPVAQMWRVCLGGTLPQEISHGRTADRSERRICFLCRVADIPRPTLAALVGALDEPYDANHPTNIA